MRSFKAEWLSTLNAHLHGQIVHLTWTDPAMISDDDITEYDFHSTVLTCTSTFESDSDDEAICYDARSLSTTLQNSKVASTQHQLVRKALLFSAKRKCAGRHIDLDVDEFSTKSHVRMPPCPRTQSYTRVIAVVYDLQYQ